MCRTGGFASPDYSGFAFSVNITNVVLVAAPLRKCAQLQAVANNK
jgi:hypothetical protein